MSMIVEYGAILKVDFRRLGLAQRKSEFFNTIGHKKSVSNQKFTVSERQETQLKGVLPYWCCRLRKPA